MGWSPTWSRCSKSILPTISSNIGTYLQKLRGFYKWNVSVKYASFSRNAVGVKVKFSSRSKSELTSRYTKYVPDSKNWIFLVIKKVQICMVKISFHSFAFELFSIIQQGNSDCIFICLKSKNFIITPDFKKSMTARNSKNLRILRTRKMRPYGRL